MCPGFPRSIQVAGMQVIPSLLQLLDVLIMAKQATPLRAATFWIKVSEESLLQEESPTLHSPMVTSTVRHGEELGQCHGTGSAHGETKFTTFTANNSHESTCTPFVLQYKLGTSICILDLFSYILPTMPRKLSVHAYRLKISNSIQSSSCYQSYSSSFQLHSSLSFVQKEGSAQMENWCKHMVK